MMFEEEKINTKSKLPALKVMAKPLPPPVVVITSEADVKSENNLDETACHESTALDILANGIRQTGSFNPLSMASLRTHAQDSLTVIPTDGNEENDLDQNQEDPGDIENQPQNDVARRNCLTEQTRMTGIGIFLMILLATCWVGVAHLLKSTYESNVHIRMLVPNSSSSGGGEHGSSATARAPTMTSSSYDAPFFTTWFCTMCNSFFFPLYLGARISSRREPITCKKILQGCVQGFREKGFTVVQFLGRCGLFCLLWVITNYMFIYSLRILDTTDVMALYSSNVSFVYLLSWVVLHEQFVGIRIVAVILCNTGIALLAYMDGASRTLTLGGVILASASAAGSAVYKVFFKKFIGEVTFGQLSLFFTLIGLFNAFLMWPLVVTLYFTHAETIFWNQLPWPLLGGAAFLSLVANLLGNFGILWTYELFLTLGLVLAVPASAAIDVQVYGVVFRGMKLAGVLLINIGFLLVLLPNNWPDYLSRLLRMRKRTYKNRKPGKDSEMDTCTGRRSRLRTPSGHVK
ncbi:putative thiamine transporter SLC35F3 isoform X1 [Limulus polyphemus]|uniref:Thiamine transporter SLC35F3 isoform X1 n=1 Tax=Limulus polyphemus TaxID=6850 RepID=A0ABM1SFC1_LIMPO|nr:putative thiamine transporter SLC35F3 isoform X1 [Limulus polyphemus]